MVSRRTWQATNGQLRTHASCSRDHAAVPVDASAASPPLGMVSMFIATASNLCLCKVHPRSSRRWQHAHLYTEDHHKVFACSEFGRQDLGPGSGPPRRAASRCPAQPCSASRSASATPRRPRSRSRVAGGHERRGQEEVVGDVVGHVVFSRHEAKMALRHEAKMATGCLTGMVTIINHQHVLGV